MAQLAGAFFTSGSGRGPIPEATINTSGTPVTYVDNRGGGAPENLGSFAMPAGTQSSNTQLPPGPFDLGNFSSLQNNGNQIDVHFKIETIPLKSGADKVLEEEPVFVYNAKRDVSQASRTSAFSLHHMNWALREAAIAKNTTTAEQLRSATSRLAGNKRRQHEMPDDNPYASMPGSIEEWCAKFQFLGYQWGGTVEDDRTVGVHSRIGSQHRIKSRGIIQNVANLWGKVRTGDRVGFMVQWEPWGKHERTNWQGDRISNPGYHKHIRCIQVVPVVGGDADNGAFAARSAVSGWNPVGGESVHVDAPAKMSDTDEMPVGADGQPLVAYDRYEAPVYIELGIIKEVGRLPDDNDRYMATQNYKGSLKLRRERRLVDIVLLPKTPYIDD